MAAQFGFADTESFARALRGALGIRRTRITDATSISLPSVQAIKKSFGVVKTRQE